MGSQQFANDQVAKLNAMIEEVEPVRPPEISVPAMMASGYLHALHDAGLVSEEEWIRYDYAIDQKSGVFARSEPMQCELKQMSAQQLKREHKDAVERVKNSRTRLKAAEEYQAELERELQCRREAGESGEQCS